MRRAILCLAVLSILLGACGTKTPADDTPTAQPSDQASAMQACKKRTPDTPAKESEQPKTAPKVEIPDGAPPCKLVSFDIFEGTGKKVKEGATVTVNYTGVSWSTGEKFDSSWDRGEPATFPLSGVIPGWTQGIPGMREGGRRELMIPPDLAYGAEGRPPTIMPGETLVFVIDLIKAE